MNHTNTVNDFMDLLDKFMISSAKNQWIYVYGFKMYVRKSRRYYNGQWLECLDLATIESVTQGTGLFTAILEEILSKYKNLNMFVESILTKRFYNFFLKYDFIPIGSPDDTNLIKLSTKN